MTSRAVSSASNAPEAVAASEGRYHILRPLGRGGMAQVYVAADAAHGGRSVALKRLQRQLDPIRHQRNLELFEREFHTLSQLAHPRIVEVYEFGVDPVGPFYTMELLDGGDAQPLAPLPWREACAVIRDVCSALSLLHSRRLVHRDVSPRNVHRTADGRAKLIDFGALAPFGTSKIVVGTPPCCPPESVQLQPLDGRTDLFALGATLYYLLVGQHAYAALHFGSLSEAWRSGFTRARQLVGEIPEALDVLLLDLLSLDPAARPANAAEVLQRLAAIDGAPISEDLQVARAYLSTPLLVGRDEPLARVRRRILQSASGRGRSVLIDGAAGVGRSRFLDACLLEASLTGSVVLRADADDARSGDYGVMRALARQLLQALPEQALAAAQPALPELGWLLPELGANAGQQPAAVPAPKLQAALRNWIRAVSRARPIAIGVDDFQSCDKRSAAVLALAAADDSEHALCVLVSSQRDAAVDDAQKVLLETATRIQLENLPESEVQKLLESLFGAVPNLGLLAQRGYALCNGNPRDLLLLAQHLIDRGTVRYEASAWTLPAQLDAADLPGSIGDALRTRIAALPAPAYHIATALAICTAETFGLEECAKLCDAQDQAALLQHIHVLLRAEIVRYVDDKLALTHPSWRALLLDALTADLAQTLERRVAQVFAQRPGGEFLAGQHLLRAGELGQAIDMLVRNVETELASGGTLTPAIARGLRLRVDDWYETYDRAARACEELQRSARDKYILRHRLAGLCAVLGRYETVHMPLVLRELRRHSGLEDYASLPSDMPAPERLKQALELAKQRYQALPERDRVLEPGSAIRDLARLSSGVTSIASVAFDIAYVRAAPDLTPFEPLAPVFATIMKVRRATMSRLTGSIERTLSICRELVVSLHQPERAGYDAVTGEYMRLGMMNALALIEAGSGLARCQQLIDALAPVPTFEVNVLVLRRLHMLMQGDSAGAEQCRQQVERVRLQTGSRLINGPGHLIWELQAHALSEDLTRMRNLIDEITPLAKEFPGWQPILLYAAAEYHRIRRSPLKALSEIEVALRLAPPGEHQIWSSLALSQVVVLLDLGRPEEALARAHSSLAAAETRLGEVPVSLQLIASLAEAHAGRSDEALATRARERADAALAKLAADAVSGIRLGFAHEIRARIALLQGDGPGFERHAEACGVAYCAYQSPALLAKYQRLRQADRGAAPERLSSTPDSQISATTRMVAALEVCPTSSQRARLALTMLLQQSTAGSGYLFMLGQSGPECSASIGDVGPSDSLLSRIDEYVQAQIAGADITSTPSECEESEAEEWKTEDGRSYRPVLLSHNVEGNLMVTGVALLAVTNSRAFSYPAQIASAISRVLAYRGDTSLLVVVE